MKLRSKVSKCKHSNFEKEFLKYSCLGDSSTDILHPAMKAIARQVGTEEDFGGPVTSTQHILPPKGASEIEMKVYQVRGGSLMGASQSGGHLWRLLKGAFSRCG